MLALTAANNMLAANSGQMIVFHPQLINDDSEAPKIPRGSVVMYTSQLMQGERGGWEGSGGGAVQVNGGGGTSAEYAGCVWGGVKQGGGWK